MLEGAFRSWIYYFLGQYVESETVNVSGKLWKSSERLKLENLTLKDSVIPSWLPFRLKTGFIGQFEADLPISAIFGSAAAKIKFVDVLLVLAPLEHDDEDEQEEVAALILDKMQRLEQDLLDRWNGPQAPELAVPHESEGYFGTDGWIGRTMTKLIDNLQIDVRNLHIRIEGVWHPSRPLRPAATAPATGSAGKTETGTDTKYAVGISLGALSAVTTPSNWRIDGFDDNQPDPAGEKSNLVFKLINALDLSAYVDPVALHFIHSRVHPLVLKSTLARLKEMGSRSAPINWWGLDKTAHVHRFLVAPITVSLKLTMNTAAQHAQTEDPRYDAVFHLSRIHGGLDEEQLSVLNLVIDSFQRHDKWRDVIAEQLRMTEKAAGSDASIIAKTCEEYLLLWKQIFAMKKGALEDLKKGEVWARATIIEKQLPFELIIATRNRLGLEGIADSSLSRIRSVSSATTCTEINVALPAGPTGITLEARASDELVVTNVKAKSPASVSACVKPGLVLVRVDGKPLRSTIQFKSGADAMGILDSIATAKVLTFRHPTPKPREVTPDRVVSKLSFSSDELTFRLVEASRRRVLCEAVLSHPGVRIDGFGPYLFSYHVYKVLVAEFYVQNTSWSEHAGNHCIASSVGHASQAADLDGDEDSDASSAIMLELNFLHSEHPHARRDDVSSYGSKYSCAIGSSVVVFDHEKMASLLLDVHKFFDVVSKNFEIVTLSDVGSSLGGIPADVGPRGISGAPTVLSETSTSPANTTLSEDPPLPPVEVSNYSYDIRVEQLVLVVSAEKKTAPAVSLPRKEPSYRLMLKQIVSREPMAAPTAPDWIKATNAIVVMQRFIRGAIVRKRKMVRLALLRSRWAYYQDDEMMGWLYVRDDSLAFRRWARVWCNIDEEGILSFHANGSGADLLDEFAVGGCTVILLQKMKGPWGASSSTPINMLEIRTSSGLLRKVLSSEDVEELKKWKECIELNARIAAKRAREMEADDEYFAFETASTTSEPFDAGGNRLPQSVVHYDGSALDEMLHGGFSDVYQSATESHGVPSWISFSVTDAVFALDVHRVSEPEQSGFSVYLGLEFLSFVDHRLGSSHGGLLHVGDRFLTLKNGNLTPGQLRSDHLHKGPFLGFNLTYRGARADPSCFVRKNGLQIDLDVSGWVKPLPLTGVLMEAIDSLSLLWTGPPPEVDEQDDTEYAPTESSRVAPWLEVMEIGIHVRAPVLEAYVEDAHCVAKLTVENSSCVYRADTAMEIFRLHVGPTALFVLTNEVALRLAQVDRLRLNYDLRLVRVTDSILTRCVLCADESARRPVAHRSISITIGQIKLEADRRLELLFALLEALTESDEADEFDEDEEMMDDSVPDDKMRDNKTHDSKKADEDLPLSGIYSDFEVNHIHRPFSQTERLNSMQFSFNDQDGLDLRPMYTGFGRQYYSSPTARSRMSTATSAGLNMQGAGSSVPGRSRQRSKISVFSPLLNYQWFVVIATDHSDRYHRSRCIFRVRLRVGRVHDRISIACYSVVFEVIKRSLSVVSLDTYIPVMNFSLSDMKIQTATRTELSVDCVLDASVEMSARYYNSALADWEPFVEPWRVYAKLSRDDGGSGTTMQLSAMQRLNVNFTDSLVRLMCSIAKNRRKRVFYVEKRTLAAVAADGEAKKADGRVCVLNNLGVPIRLANLNTSHAGTLHVDIRDGWSFPAYARFHNVRVEVTLLPWWNPREAETVENFRHKFALPYGGAQSGVTPILRVDVLSTEKGKREYVFDHVTNRYVEVDAEEDELAEMSQPETLTQSAGARMIRGDSSSSQKAKWYSIGTAEINLAGSVLGSVASQRSKSNRWYRLRDLRGNVTGEIFVGLDFLPHYNSAARGKINEPEQVRDGQFLVFDPLKIVTTRGAESSRKASVDASKDHVLLSDGLRGNYIPPLALEVQIGTERCNLLCPLRRAGKFLIQGDKVLAEVKVAQRDESRRVLLLSSPVQVKNDMSIDMDVWTIETQEDEEEGRRSLYDRSEHALSLPSGNKISVPISALYGEKKHSVIVKVDGCKPTVVADLGSIATSSTVLTLEPEHGHGLGYCVYVNITAHMRKVYREEHQDIVTRGNAIDGDVQAYATKYQISLHACLVFENTLPVRVQYQIVARAQPDATMLVARHGTLSPGEEVPIHEFQKNAQLMLRLPEMDSLWSRPILLGDCIYREVMAKEIKALLDASGSWDPVVEFIPSLPSTDVMFKKDDIDTKRVTARLDYTAADDGSPRIVLYTSLWVYNHSHVQTLLFRCADTPNTAVVFAPQLVPQRPVPRLMDCPDQEFEISTIIDHEVSRWSDKIHSAVVGIQAPISLRFGNALGPKTRNELGISIQRPMGQFHRTTQVTVTSRYVFVNRTNAPFKVAQFARDNDSVVELPVVSSKGVPSTTSFDFDVSSQSLKRQVYLRMDHHGAEWSGPFTVVDEIEFSLKLRGSVIKSWGDSTGGYEREGLRRSTDEMHRVKVRITNVGASVVITLARDEPPMYVICNETSSDLFVNQVNFSNDTVVVRSNEFIPFAWVQPDRSWRVACRVGTGGRHPLTSSVACVYDFANLDRERKMEGLRYRIFGNQLRSISAEIVVDRSSRVLVFRDHGTDCPPSYILEVKLIAARLRDEVELDQDAPAEIVVTTDNHPPMIAESKELRTAHVYRFDADLEFACESRPKKLTVSFYDKQVSIEPRETESSTIQMEDECFYDNEVETDRNMYPPGSPTTTTEATPFEMMRTPVGSPRRPPPSNGSSSMLLRPRTFYHHGSDLSQLSGLPLRISDAENVEQSYRSSEDSEELDMDSEYKPREDPTGTLEIKLPKKAWSRPGASTKQSIALTYNTAEQAKLSLGRSEGHWWEMRDPETGDLIGEVLVALKFRTSVRELSHPTDIFNMSVTIPSIGFSFLHNAKSTMVEVAYLSMQRFGLLYSCADTSSEVVFSLGNLQMDNQMEQEVVLGPKVHRVKEGVSVRLRDRWQSFTNYRYRGIFDELDVSSMSAIQFRMLWNSSCSAGEFTHYELIELVMPEIEVSTDEKFVVNLISVFQGIESLATHRSFEELVDTRLDYVGGSSSGGGAGGNAGGGGGPTAGGSGNSVSGAGGGAGAGNLNDEGAESGGVYIEQLDIEAIRITFSMELHGGRYLKTLGPSGRRLAVYLPESSVKDFPLNLTKLSFRHLYEPKANVMEKVTRRYQQQAVLLVLSGLHTVSVYANPIRIVYRFAHGVLELVRLPARGLASGSPIELISGAYLGVRSLAMNVISASYEIVAGAAGIFGAVARPLVPESKRKAFEDDLIGFQRAVFEEVNSFDAAEDRTMTKVIVRKPRVFDASGVGLLTVYGPGSVPMEEQDRINHRAIVVLQHWWRRRRRANILLQEAMRLRPDVAEVDRRLANGVQCALM